MAQTYQIVNRSRDSSVATAALLANTFWSRGRGLMGRASLAPGEGLMLYPNNTIHMFFMRFPIDVLFVDRNHQVVALREHFPPWHPFAGSLKARYVIELPINTIAQSYTKVGDLLAYDPAWSAA